MIMEYKFCCVQQTAEGWSVCMGDHPPSEKHKWVDLVPATTAQRVREMSIALQMRLSIAEAKLEAVKALIRGYDQVPDNRPG